MLSTIPPKQRRVPEPKITRKVVFNVSQSFKVDRVLGEGAYGIVCLAVHEPTSIPVAIKKIEPFEKPLFCLRTLREIKLLTKFRGHENIIQLFDVQKPLSYDHFNEVYLIQEFMPSDLAKVIQTHVLSDEHCQYFTYQILRGLKYIHSANVIHRDLKPSNVLINGSCDVKICDFGLARLDNLRHKFKDDTSGAIGGISALTEYVATRWYRAPEIMLTASQYSTAIDLWSVGCILGEFFTYIPLFPGTDYRNQLSLIFELLGTPTGSDFHKIKSPRAKAYINTLPFRKKLDIDSVLNNHPMRLKKIGNVPINPLGLDLLKRLLTFDPEKRITVDQALAHPYLKNYHDPNDEPITTPMSAEEFDFDVPKDQLSTEVLKREMFEKIMNR
ncbi:mitogen-activated protein kinase [Suhomyces tanzawaensis NRRL Y-17324]|uniref:Mitogen-activated protein kinase n=1 Tax=Suhomyces tanzawaensis NRRL Y-17324 TaxID=984487 RepID=A0A1E4SR80_9ASCO|nr:mitogen-activated protein kinase [Suhomyces tanzawaensis NRRL Y-17324]ODV82026.1 mitogen-activated protein kinase [Suhomyces tanzawaensis NRRL Y-17324]